MQQNDCTTGQALEDVPLKLVLRLNGSLRTACRTNNVGEIGNRRSLWNRVVQGGAKDIHGNMCGDMQTQQGPAKVARRVTSTFSFVRTLASERVGGSTNEAKSRQGHHHSQNQSKFITIDSLEHKRVISIGLSTATSSNPPRHNYNKASHTMQKRTNLRKVGRLPTAHNFTVADHKASPRRHVFCRSNATQQGHQKQGLVQNDELSFIEKANRRPVLKSHTSS